MNSVCYTREKCTLSKLGLENIDPTTISALTIQNSNNLSSCGVSSICSYLSDPTNTATISGNAAGCATRIEVEASCAPTCPTANITFSQQSEVDDFSTNYPNCTDLPGHVTVSGSTITNLDGLSQITSIGDNLILSGNDLANVNGLSNLTTIGGHLNVDCPSLDSLSGFNSLLSIGGNLNFIYSPNLSSLSGLDSLTSIGGHLMLNSNSSISNLNPLQRLKTIGGNLTVEDFDGITNFSGLDSLSAVGGHVTIKNNNSIVDFAGLNGLASIGGKLFIESNSALVNINYLNNVSALEGFHVFQNYALTDISGLNNLTTIGTGGCAIEEAEFLININGFSSLDSIYGYFTLSSLLSLTNLSGFSNLSYVGSNCYIGLLENIPSFNGFQSLNKIGGNLIVEENYVMMDFTGLHNLSSVGGDLWISNYQAITDISALSSLTSIGGILYIDGLSALTSLAGLDNVDPMSITNLSIQNSGNLSLCDVPSVCSYLGNASNPATVIGNATGCATRAEIETACTPTCLTTLSNVTAYVNTATQATIGWDKESTATYAQQVMYKETTSSTWIKKNVRPYPTNAYLLGNLSPNTNYHYRARMRCGPGLNGPWSPLQSFTTYTTDPCSSPLGNLVMYHYIWDYSRVRLVTNYEPDANNNMNIQVRWKEVAGTTWQQRNLYGRSYVNAKFLMPNTDYEVQWRARCTNQWTPWTASEIFTTLAANPLAPPIVDRDELDNERAFFDSDIQVFPNPVSSMLTIRSKQQSIQCSLFDVRGALVLQQHKGAKTIEMDLNGLSSGLYILHIVE